MRSSLGHKLTLLVPPLTVFPSFLKPQDLVDLRSWFQKQDSRFEFKDSNNGVCRLRQCKLSSADFPEWQLRLQFALDQLASDSKLGQLSLKFENLFCKQYAPGDAYGEHIDQSPSQLSFLFQFALDDRHQLFPDFQLAGKAVPFQDNQLLIFHSSLPHSYHHRVDQGSKGIVQVLPEISIC